MDDFLKACFGVAVAAADPMAVLKRHLPPTKPEGLFVVGAGKASARMAEALEAEWGPCEGLVITRYGHGRPTQGIEIVEASHPVPDEAGVQTTQRILARAERMGAGETLLVLLSGGASSLLCAPLGLSLEEKQQVNAALLASGAPIGEMNVLRKHLSAVKGGQLAAAAFPAQVICLMISDVPGDAPELIGSGPTVGEAAGLEAARSIAARWAIPLPQSALKQSGVLLPEDPRLAKTQNQIIAAPKLSLEAAADFAQAKGWQVEILGDALEGEARDVALAHAALARQTRGPKLFLSGGELTVRRSGQGIGGPNAEYCLALALALAGEKHVFALACDTDGIDGAAEVAGAFISPNTLTEARRLGLDAADFLARNDAHSFFAALGAQVITGPTLTNDFRALLIME